MKNYKIKPLSKNSIPVVFSFNNEYSKYFSVALLSLIESAKPCKNYDIVVFSTDISNRNKKLIQGMLPSNFNLRFFDVSGYITNLLDGINLQGKKYWSVDMYYRMIIPLIMNEYEKVLYIDSDVIFNKDISELFSIDFENKKLLVVSDSFNLVSSVSDPDGRVEYIKETLNLADSDTYFNSGVLLFNISEFNTREYTEKLKKTFNEIQKTHYPDQDLLNCIFKGKTKLIDQQWNLQYHLPIFHKKEIPFINKSILDKYFHAFESPAIIHYTSPVKPWNCPENDLAEYFWKYARKTVYYEEILSSMYKNEIYESRYATHLYLKLQSGKKVILWGASLFLEKFFKKYEIQKEFFPNILGIIDKELSKKGEFWGDYEIFSPEDLETFEADEIILTIINSPKERYRETLSYLKDKNIDIKLTRL